MALILLRWTARILGTLFFLFFAFMFFADLFGSNNDSPKNHSISIEDIAMLSLMWTSVIGLMLSWKWELIGACITLLSFIVQALVNSRVLQIHILYLPSLVAILFVMVWYKGKKERESA